MKKARGGRPSLKDAARLRDKILDAAAHLFFTEGYGATSIEAVSKRARISKRTFYTRFQDKPDLFRAVMNRLLERLTPPGNVEDVFKGRDIEETLLKLAKLMLQASLQPETVAMNRLILAEAARFPEVAMVVNQQGARQHAIAMITKILEKEITAKRLTLANPAFAAEQFLQMVIGSPQRRAFGLGKPMTARELDQWAEETVSLFLTGCTGSKN